MLLPSATVSAWYRRDSFIYRQFAFTFANPLWSNAVPNGFSVCPFFWLAIFSMVVLRPLVYLTLGVRVVIRLLRISSLVRFTDSLCPIRCETFALSTVCTGLILGVYTLGMCAIHHVALHDHWNGKEGPTPNSFPFLYGFVTTAMVGLFALIYHEQHEHDPAPCRVWYYPLAAFLGSLVYLAFAAPILYWRLFVGLPVGCWHVLVIVALWLWHGLGFLLTALLAGSAGFLIVAGAMAAAVVIGYLYDRYANPPSEVDPKVVKANEDSIVSYLDKHVNPNVVTIRRVLLRYVPLFAVLARKLALSDEDYRALYDAFGPAYTQYQLDENAKQAARGKTCKAITGALAAVFAPIGRNLWAFLSWVWMFVWSFKTKACPYFTFTDSGR